MLDYQCSHMLTLGMLAVAHHPPLCSWRNCFPFRKWRTPQSQEAIFHLCHQCLWRCATHSLWDAKPSIKVLEECSSQWWISPILAASLVWTPVRMAALVSWADSFKERGNHIFKNLQHTVYFYALKYLFPFVYSLDITKCIKTQGLGSSKYVITSGHNYRPTDF